MIVGFLFFWCPQDITHILNLIEQHLIGNDLRAVIGCKLEINIFFNDMVYCWNLYNIWFYFLVVYLTTLFMETTFFPNFMVFHKLKFEIFCRKQVVFYFRYTSYSAWENFYSFLVTVFLWLIVNPLSPLQQRKLCFLQYISRNPFFRDMSDWNLYHLKYCILMVLRVNLSYWATCFGLNYDFLNL